MADSYAASPPPRRKSPALVPLAALVIASAVIRTIVAWQHSIPRLFPDEYIYATLGQSIGHGHYAIRGVTSHFPGVFEPLVAAPIWGFFDPATAYHLVQSENAVAASVAAIPVYFLARSLRLSSAYSLACAVYALLIPQLILVAFTSSDVVAYPLALAAVLTAVAAIDAPTGSRQVLFLFFATLATLTRVEYFVLVPAYLAGAVVVDRRDVFRRHRVALIAIAPAAIVILIAAVGYYSGLKNTRFDAGYVRWFFVQMFLLSIEAGVLIVPAAVGALIRPATRRETGFAVFAGALALLLFGEAAAYAANSHQFKERYLFVLLALIPIAFGLSLQRPRRNTWVIVGVALAMAVGAARLPLSEYATATFKSDSEFLFAVSYAQDRLGTASTSLAIALVTTALALAAIGLSFRKAAAWVLAVPVVVLAASTGIATHVDIDATRAVRARLPSDLTWINRFARGPVTAIETPVALRSDLLQALYWNDSIRRELLLSTAIATDAFDASKLELAPDGTLKNVSGDFLFHDYGTTGRFSGARPVARAGGFTLWRPKSRVRFRLDLEGRFNDGWLSSFGRIRAWPLDPTKAVRLSFALSVPTQRSSSVRVTVRRTTLLIKPGHRVNVTCESGKGAFDVRFRATGIVVDQDFRKLSARLSHLEVSDQPPTRNIRSSCRNA